MVEEIDQGEIVKQTTFEVEDGDTLEVDWEVLTLRSRDGSAA